MATDTSAPPIVEHFHLNLEVPPAYSDPAYLVEVMAFLPGDVGTLPIKPNTKYTITPCRNRDCAPIPEPPPETTLDRLKIHVDSCAEDLNTWGTDCFEQDEEERNRRLWEQAENEDSDIDFHEQGHVAKCLYCDVEIELIADYSAQTGGAADSCVDPCEHLVEVLARVQSASNAYIEVYDMTWTVAQDGDIMGVRLQIAGGGPSIYIDTRAREVQGFWGAAEYSRYISSAQDILEYFEDFAPEITRQ